MPATLRPEQLLPVAAKAVPVVAVAPLLVVVQGHLRRKQPEELVRELAE